MLTAGAGIKLGDGGSSWSTVSGDGNRGFHVVIIRSSGLILAEVAATEADTGNLSDGVSANARLETAGSVKAVEQKT